MPVYPLYRATRRLDDTWDECADKYCDPMFSFTPIPDDATSHTGRFFLHTEGGQEIWRWFRAEFGARVEDSPAGPVLITRTAKSGLAPRDIAHALTIQANPHGIRPADAPSATPTPTPERPAEVIAEVITRDESRRMKPTNPRQATLF